MAEYIAHASIDENRKTKGGNAGDQTGKEVCIRTMYFKPWNQFFHIENDKVRKQFGNNMIDIAKNNNIGYDQNQRNTLLTQAKKVNFDFTKIATKCETDCSAAITTALLGAIYTVLGNTAYESAYGVMVNNGNCATTSTFKARVTKLTVVKVTCYTSSTYTGSTKKAVYGDIYNKSGSHIVCYIANGNKVTSTTSTPTNTVSKPSTGNQIIKKGQQHAINFTGKKIKVDGLVGNETRAMRVRVLQHALNLDYRKTTIAEDGKLGKKTKAKLGWHYVKKGERQYLVTALEILLMLRGIDTNGVETPGIYGSGLASAVNKYFGGDGKKVTASMFLKLVQ